MAKPLSQDEIDILLEVRTQLNDADDYDLAQLESMVAADSDRRINPYNFKRPRLYAQDQMRVLNHVHEAFARDLSVYLSAQLRTIVDINLTAVDQVLYSEYVMSSAPPSAIYVVEVEELNQKIIFELDPRLVIFTIEKLFGGPGVFLRKPREVSQIERRIMSKVMQRAFRELEKAWHQVFDMALKEVAFESNAEFVQIIPGVEPALVSTFEVVIYEQRSFINICYPYRLLERVLGRTGMKQWISSATTQVSPAVRERYENTVRGVDVEVRAELGRARLPVAELRDLAVGDVIPLRQKIGDSIRVFVDKQDKFRAAPGRAGKRRALQIMELIETELTPEDNEHR
ncbi:MAG: flagellar motor switch protein FliM [Rhodothermales bacterium]